MIDNQDLVICSEKFTYLSLRKGAMLASEKEKDKSGKDIVSMYRNRSPTLHNLSMDEYFYKHFCREVLDKDGDVTDRTKHRILLPVGQNCKPRYPVTYEYAKGVLIQHKPWSKDKTLTKLLKNKEKTIRAFKRMLDAKQFPSSVTSQYKLAMKYSQQAKLEFVHSKGMEQPYDLNNMDENERDRYVAHQHVSHFSDNKHHNKVIDGVTVDIGTDEDWTLLRYDGVRTIDIEGELWVDKVREDHYNAVRDQAASIDNLVIPKQKDGMPYSVDSLSSEQKQIVYGAVDTIVKFLNNDPSYKPMRATVMGSGGTGKSFIVNTIIGMVRTLTSSNDTVQIAAPSGAAAYNVQGSTIHNLLGVGVTNPENPLSEGTKKRLLDQLEHLLVLIIDERSMISSKVLAAAERNTRECIYGGQNTTELWGGLPVVLFFGDDYQLMPVAGDGAISGYAKRVLESEQYVTDKMTRAQLFRYRGDWLFTEIMTDQVFALTKNYRVQCKEFMELLERVRKGRANSDDADKMMKLHQVFYRADTNFKDEIENDEKTMWLFANNQDVREKNVQRLVKTSKQAKVPVARLNCCYDTNKTQNGRERCAIRSHFDDKSYMTNTDICVGARVALRKWNILPSAGLYNGSIGTVVEIVYKNNPVGPNDKEHYHLPDYVVVDFPHLQLPPHIRPWDKNNPTVTPTCVQFVSSCTLITHTLSFIPSHVLCYHSKHVPIPARITPCRKRCCTVTWCPLETSWATTIHKFQGFEAGFDRKDMFKRIIVDPGDIKWEQSCPGALYVSLSRAKTMGTFASDTSFPRDSAIYWNGSGISTVRIREGHLRKGDRSGDPKQDCKRIFKRRKWVAYLEQMGKNTPVQAYTKSQRKRMKSVLTQVEVKKRITGIITKPNKTWAGRKKEEKYGMPRNYFGNYA